MQLAPLREAVPPSTRFVLVTATLAEPVFAQLQRDFPGIAAAFGPGEPTTVCLGCTSSTSGISHALHMPRRSCRAVVRRYPFHKHDSRGFVEVSSSRA